MSYIIGNGFGDEDGIAQRAKNGNFGRKKRLVVNRPDESWMAIGNSGRMSRTHCPVFDCIHPGKLGACRHLQIIATGSCKAISTKVGRALLATGRSGWRWFGTEEQSIGFDP